MNAHTIPETSKESAAHQIGTIAAHQAGALPSKSGAQIGEDVATAYNTARKSVIDNWDVAGTK